MKELLNKLNEIKDQRIELTKQLKTEFNKTLKQIFIDNPDLEMIFMPLNNHEFNDGDATRFYLGYDDLTLTIKGEEIERDYEKDHNSPVMNTIYELFDCTQDIHEDMFGGEYGSLKITRKSIINEN